MKKLILIILLCVFAFFATGLRARYGPNFWRVVSGSIVHNTGPVVVGTAFNYAVDTASDDDYLTVVQGVIAYNTGLVIWLNPVTANTDGATLNINSLGAKAIEGQDGGALTTNDILATGIYLMVYDGTNFLLQE